VMGLARASNGYFDVKAPWKQRKEDLAACGTTLNVCVQTVRTLSTLMAPFLPFSAAKCQTMLGLEELPWQCATTEIAAGHRLGEPVILFAKLDAADLVG
jgi:methionyl-tRNA synthetase